MSFLYLCGKIKSTYLQNNFSHCLTLKRQWFQALKINQPFPDRISKFFHQSKNLRHYQVYLFYRKYNTFKRNLTRFGGHLFSLKDFFFFVIVLTKNFVTLKKMIFLRNFMCKMPVKIFSEKYSNEYYLVYIHKLRQKLSHEKQYILLYYKSI